MDISDATMAYFLVTGDEHATLTKLQNLLENRIRPQPLNPRATLRMEAENFVTLQHYTVVFGDRLASKRLKVQGAPNATGRIQDGIQGTLHRSRRALRRRRPVLRRQRRALHLPAQGEGGNAGASWVANAESNTWRTQTLTGVVIRRGDAVEVEVRTGGTERGQLDYVDLTFRGVEVTPRGRRRRRAQ